MSIDLSAYKNEQPLSGGSTLFKPVGIGRGFTDKNKEMFYRELGMLLRSGVDFKKSLEILIGMTKNSKEKELITALKKDIIEGSPVYEAMMATGKFSPYEYYSVQIGEETRRLEEVLSELQKFYTRKIQMKRQMVSVLTYPVIVLSVTFLVLYFMLTRVVPMFESVFRQFNSELPKSTQVILMLSKNSGVVFGITGIIIAALVALHYAMRKKAAYRAVTSSLVLKMPFFGPLVQKIYLSRFCQSMSLLTSARTPLINALDLTGKMIGYYPIESSLANVKQDIISGGSLSNSFRKHKVYEEKMVSMVDVAEQVNQLDIMFEKLTEQYNEEIAHKTKMVGVILEPAIIIIIGLIVGTIMISMYAPMFDLSKIINR